MDDKIFIYFSEYNYYRFFKLFLYLSALFSFLWVTFTFYLFGALSIRVSLFFFSFWFILYLYLYFNSFIEVKLSIT